MRFPRILLLLSLFVSLAAFAAPPVVTLLNVGAQASVSVPAGHRVAWIASGQPMLAGVAEDSDGDGIVTIDPHITGPALWTVADVETGEWAYAWPYNETLTVLPVKADRIIPNAAGDHALIVLDQYQTGGIWVRPGVGVWGRASGGWPSSSYVLKSNITIVDATQLAPLGSSPATPAGFEHGDVLLTGTGWLVAGVVDAALDAPRVPGSLVLTTGGSTFTEGATINLDVVRLAGTTGTITADVGITPSAGMQPGVDYEPFSTETLTFAQGEVAKRITVKLLDDSSFTTFTRTPSVVLRNPTGGAVISGTGRFTILELENDPRPTVAFGAVPSSVVEGDTAWTLDVPWSVNGGFRGSIDVRFSVNNGTSTTTTVTPENPQRVSSVPIAANDITNPPQTIYLELNTPYSSSVYRTIQVTDDDPPSWTTTDIVVRESQWYHVDFPFTLTAAPSTVAGLTYTTADGLATAGQDFVAKTATIPIYDEYNPVSIQLYDDAVAEGNEMFYVDVLSTSGPVQPPTRTRFTITIIDNDAEPPPVSLSVDPVLEGDSGWKEIPVTVRLASPATSDITVTVRPAVGGTADTNDYAAQATAFEFLAGETEKTYKVSIRGDLAVEDVETVVLQAVSRSGAVVATTSIEIIDNDSQSFISVADVEVDETAAEATFVISFSEAPGSSGSFDYETTEFLATDGVDYIGTSGKIEFGPNDTRKEVRVQLVDDTSIEGNETFALKLSNLTGASGVYLHRNIGFATIRDDDTPAPPIITLAATSPLEGDSGQKSVPVVVRLAAVVSTPVEVAILTQQGTAGAGTDYVPLSTTVTFQPGETEKQVTVNILGDTIGEGDETLTIIASYDGAIAATMILTIKDDDTIHYVAVSDTGVVEGTGSSSTASFKIDFLPPPPNGGTLHYETEDDTAGSADYAHASGTIAFVAGNTSLSIPVEVFGDATGEKDERFRLRISNPTGGVQLFDEVGVATIFDDDGPIVRPTLTIEDVAVTETNAASEARFTLRLSKAGETNVSVHYSTADHSALAGADYETRSGTITFAPGQTTKTIVVPIVGDTTHEEMETFFVVLSNGNGAVIPNLLGTCTITDDDAAEEKRTKRRTSRH